MANAYAYDVDQIEKGREDHSEAPVPELGHVVRLEEDYVVTNVCSREPMRRCPEKKVGLVCMLPLACAARDLVQAPLRCGSLRRCTAELVAWTSVVWS